MNLKVYEKTRYQNIYRHKKNKNYVIAISKPVKTSIADINGKKIYKIEDAVKIRDNPKVKAQKGAEVKHNGMFDDYWAIYMNHCKYDLKLAYNTIKKKEKIYNAYLKDEFTMKLPKITKEILAKTIDDANTTDKQKNEILDEVKAFFKWCKLEDYIMFNPALAIEKYDVTKSEMKYWTEQNLNDFLNYVNSIINSDTEKKKKKEIAYRSKIITILGIALGDRIGETRALSFDCFNTYTNVVKILHSINYDRTSDDFVSNTKTYESQRESIVTSKLINTVLEYRNFLENEMEYNVKDDTLLFFNFQTKKPFSDNTLRKGFYKLCKEANVPHIRLYDIRHTFAALMMAEGVELYQISRKMGHTNYATTVNQYGHLAIEIKKKIANLTDKFY